MKEIKLCNGEQENQGKMRNIMRRNDSGEAVIMEQQKVYKFILNIQQ